MMQRRKRLKARLWALSVSACLVATQAGAQADGGGLPTAREIWRHLYPLPDTDKTSEPAPLPAPAPTPRPTPSASAVPRPGAPAAATPRGAPAAAARRSVPKAAAAVPSRTLAQARVVIHYPARGGYERSEELVRLLRALGTGEVETRPVRYLVEQQSIRYFHAADRDVSGIIGDMVGGGGRATVSDFTYFRPSPRGGTVEIWLP